VMCKVLADIIANKKNNIESKVMVLAHKLVKGEMVTFFNCSCLIKKDTPIG
jgi:hypothetical protein